MNSPCNSFLAQLKYNKLGIRAESMAKKNTKISVVTVVVSMEEAVSLLQDELGELKGAMTSLKDCMQQVF